MHIYTVTVACLYIIIIIFNFAHFFLSLLHLHNQHPHHLLLPLIHTLPQTKSKISPKNQKSTTDTTKPNIPTHGHINGDRESRLALVADRLAWIGVLGSACLYQRSSHRAWIRVLLAVLGSEFLMEI